MSAAPLRLAMFSAQSYDRRFFEEARAARSADVLIDYHDTALDIGTAVLAQDCAGVCVFVNDVLDAAVLERLHGLGVRAILLRCAGFNNVDLAALHRSACSPRVFQRIRRKRLPSMRWP